MRVGILQVSLDAAQADRATVERERDAAQAERDAARRDKATAEEQRDLFRDIYGKATAFVDEKSAENKELQKRITIAEKAAKEGVALVQATFAQREETIRAETKDWRNQANILRELAVRTHDEELRRRAALYPEAQARCKRLEDEREVLNAALGQAHHGIRMKNDELTRLEMRLDERADEREGMKDQIRQASDDIDVKNDEIARLEMRVEEQAAEVERLTGELATAGLSKVDRTVGPDCLVHRCLWRMEVPNAACNALFRDNEVR
jgi:chromosome segregation ATPase